MKSTSTENPFAVPAKRPAVFRALKALCVIVFCLGTVLTIQFGSQYWLLHQLTSNWDSQPVAVRVERLDSLAGLDNLGRPMLVRALTDPHRRVAHSAFDHLLDQQAAWVAMPDAQADEKYRQLVEQLTKVAADLPADRRGWLATLLNATIVETVEHSSEDATLAYAQATKLLADSPLKHAPAEVVETSSSRVALRSEALPVDLMAEDDVGEILLHPLAGASNGPAPPNDTSSPEFQEAPVENEELQPISEANASTGNAKDASLNDTAERVVVPVQHLTDAPFETYSTRSVIAWLRSVQPKLRDIARSELIRRGFGEPELELAARMADPDIRVRLGLLNDLSQRGDIDPRPWLLWMAEDAERDVRLRALTSLATMQDPNVHEKLRERLQHESDPAVVSLLRRVLSR